MMPNIRKLCSLKSKNQRLVTCLSLSTMCLLITASIVFITIISITPIIILNLGEINTGQRDLILEPQIQFVNSTKIQQLSNQIVMPRLQTVVEVEDLKFGQGWFIDFTKQRQNHLGTIAGNQPKNHKYVYAHSGLSLKSGEKVTLKIIQTSFINTILSFIQTSDFANKQKMYDELFKIMQVPIGATFQVKDVFDTASGKFPIGKVNRFIYLDLAYAFQQMINATIQKHPSYLNFTVENSTFVKYINNPNLFQLGQFSSQATINIPNRIQRYSSSDYEGTYDYLSSFASKVITSIGIFPVTSSMPIASNLIIMSYFGMFIGVILKLIIVSLFMVSAIMMNNMLTMTVSQRQFEMAVYKTIGANRLFVILVVLLDSLKYVLVANLIAFPFAYTILTFAGDMFQSFFGFKYDIYPTFEAIFGGLFIGILVPIISSLSPIASILNNKLVEHLNPIRNKTQAIHTQIYVDGRQFPYGKLFFGVIATSFGLMIYYLLPKGIINQDITLLMFVFFTILLGLLIGLILISISFQYLIEKFLAYAFLFWINGTDFILILKNLSAHRFKNRRSSILYALSVALVVFLSVGIQIQIQTIYHQMLKYHASFVQIKGLSLNRNFYDQLLASTKGVQDWSYITAELSQSLLQKYGVQSVMVSDSAKLYFADNKIYGVSPNFLNTFYYKTISVQKTDSKPPYDPYSYLYSSQGSNTSTLSKFMAQKFNIFDSQNHQYLISYYWKDKVIRIPQNYSSLFSKRVGLKYSPFTSKKSQIGVSIDRFIQLAGLSSYEDVPYSTIKVKLKDPSQSMKIANVLQKQMSEKNSDTIWQYSELNATITRIQGLLTNVLNILLVVVLVISFFSLVTTSYINILNQTAQIGILLCLGYSKKRLYKIYILQTFIVVVNSCLIGVAVGWFVAWMMGLQRQLFSDYPIKVQINGLDIIVVSALISSLLSTYKPLKELFSISISQVLNYA